MSDSEEIEELSDICVVSKDEEISKNANSVGEKSQSIGSKSDLVYDYFQLVDSTGGSRCLVQGCKCEGEGRNVTTMKRHLESKHKSAYQEYETKSQKKEEALNNKGQKKVTDTFVVFPKQCYDWRSPKAKLLRKKLAYLIGVTNIPLSIINDAAFTEFCSALDEKFQLPKSAQTIRSSIYVLRDEMKIAIREKLSKAESVVIILDIWSQKGVSRSFLGVCASFADPSESFLTVVGLAVKEFMHPHTAGLLKEHANMILDDFGVSPSKVSRYVSDNGSNIAAAFKHDVVAEVSIEEENPENAELRALPTYNVYGVEEEDELFDDDEVEQDSSIVEEIRSFPHRLSYSAHHLNLVSEAAFSKTSFKALKEQVLKVVNRCAHSGKATEMLVKLSGKKFLTSAPTRWLSFYLVAVRMLELKVTFIEVTKELRWSIVFSRDLLEEAKNLMKPLYDVVTFLEGDRYPTALCHLFWIQRLNILKYKTRFSRNLLTN